MDRPRANDNDNAQRYTLRCEISKRNETSGLFFTLNVLTKRTETKQNERPLLLFPVALDPAVKRSLAVCPPPPYEMRAFAQTGSGQEHQKSCDKRPCVCFLLQGRRWAAVPAPGNIYVTPLRFKLSGRPILSAHLNVETARSERKQPEI
jgi:hypothetical protein